ncbi:hypothetical protein EON64_16110, partial [archaeon]
MIEEKSVETQPETCPSIPPVSLSSSSAKLGECSVLLAVPKVRRGEMELLATGVMKKWKPWFFILDRGVLSHFEIEHLYFQEKFDLKGYEFVEHYPEDTSEVLRMQHHSKPDIILRAAASREEWAASLSEHLTYLRAVRLSTQTGELAVGNAASAKRASLTQDAGLPPPST